MNFKACLVVAINLFLSIGAHADEALYSQMCAACHMPDGAGNAAMNAPSIAGMSSSYIARQLSNFKSGIRGGASQDMEGQMMQGVVSSLSDEAITSVAEYLSTLPFKPVVTSPMDSTDAFAVLFEGRGLYSGCKSCHGADASGVEALGAPRLAGQYPSYLRRQIQHFKDGVRGANPEDTHGHQMAVMAASIPSGESLDALLQYIHQLSDK